jgi:uncharacterized protein YybS (DUF2232 family)
MFPWGPDRILFVDPASPDPTPAGEAPQESASGSRLRLRTPKLVRIVPFFLSALFFLSAFFAVFAPLPILLLAFRTVGRRSRLFALLAALTNGVVVFVAAGGASALIYCVFVVAPALAIIEVLHRKKTLEKAALAALISIVLAAAVALVGYSRVKRVNPASEIKQGMSLVVDQLAASFQANAPKEGSDALEPADIEEWKQDAWVELPSAIAVSALVLVWVNLMLLLRINPLYLRERLKIDAGYFLSWRAPEWLVWPTIVAGVTVLFDIGVASEWGRNLFKFFMAIYAIQGISVMAFFFQQWKVHRLLQAAGYIVAILLVMPLLLAIGFFDLWFDFRAKFRQT